MHHCHNAADALRGEAGGGEGEVFAHLPPNPGKLSDRLAGDGVSCTVCHQITEERLGTRDSFRGGFQDRREDGAGERTSSARSRSTQAARQSCTRRRPHAATGGKHIRSSELCATCHTLITKALDAQGKVIGELPEQVPYQEWLHSEFKETKSCQSCHMPVVTEDVPISSVFGEMRQGFARHTFVGGNFFMQRSSSLRTALSVTFEPHGWTAR